MSEFLQLRKIPSDEPVFKQSPPPSTSGEVSPPVVNLPLSSTRNLSAPSVSTLK